jgi:nucleoside-diphosphate-sugar epimerase
MDVLMLGGTSFVGRGIVADLLERGHSTTCARTSETG